MIYRESNEAKKIICSESHNTIKYYMIRTDVLKKKARKEIRKIRNFSFRKVSHIMVYTSQ